MHNNSYGVGHDLIYIRPIEKSLHICSRVLGLQKLATSGLKYPSPIFIVEHNAFQYFRKFGSLPRQLETEVRWVFSQIRSAQPTRGVYVGRAYFVPGIANPPGPRSSSVMSANVVLQEITKIFTFAIRNNLTIPDAQIGCILYPFINPVIPYGGGSIHPSDLKKNTVIVEAIYGVDEGIQSLPHDCHMLNVNTLRIDKSHIPIKKYCLEVSSELAYKKISVPRRLQRKPVLSKTLLGDLLSTYRTFTSKYGAHRLEFAIQQEGIYFRECVPYTRTDQKAVHASGIVERVMADITPQQTEHIPRDRILFIDPDIIQTRKMNVITSLAFRLTPGRIILYPGSASTAHAATILREKGLTVVFVRDHSYRSGDAVRIVTRGRNIHVSTI